jgi:hypothetical protein
MISAMNFTVVCDVTPCSLVDIWPRFGCACYVSNPGTRVERKWMQYFPPNIVRDLADHTASRPIRQLCSLLHVPQ